MKLTIKNKGSNYLAQIVKLPKPYKHPNADKLQCVVIQNNVVITGMTAKEGDIYVYFPLECAINKDYLKFSNSYRDKTLNADQTKVGFFESTGRVKAVKLRNQKSEGYIIPVYDLIFWLASRQIEVFDCDDGLEFDSIGDIIICEKYVPPYVRTKGSANTPKKKTPKVHSKLVENQFRFHTDTAQLKKNIHLLKPEHTVSITYKLHGTSAVFANVLCKRKLKWYEKLLKKCGIKIEDTYYDKLYSSRSVLKNAYEDKKHNHFYDTDIWGEAFKLIKDNIQVGYTLYAEIVGFTPSGAAIQKGYDYGCAPNTFEVYVYRITFTNVAGEVFELSFPQMQRYCEKYGIKYVPLFFYGMAQGFKGAGPENEWHNYFLNSLSCFLEKDCHMCNNKVPAEGVVVAIEGDTFQAFKLKSFAFFERESKELDKGEVDIETAESLPNES